MKLFRLLFQRELLAPVSALVFASGVCITLVFARIISSGNIGYAFLAWNLFLAWLPLVFALLIQEHYGRGERRHWRMAGLGAAWLLFFPNAPYIFTDLVHLKTNYPHFWIDMILILLCALTGLMLGFISLYLVQSVVADRFGRMISWLFVLGVAGLSGVGVFLGRFLRLNSWDVLLRPGRFYRHMDHWMSDPFGDVMPYVFPALFAVFLLVTYLMFYALTQLPQTLNFRQQME